MQVKNLSSKNYAVVEHYDAFDVMQNQLNNEKSLHSLQQFATNEVISKFSAAAVLNQPTYLTVQVDVEKHILLNPTHLQYINHSCNPNVFFDTATYELKALKPIEVGDELTFFYPSTEWEMQQPFACTCGYKNCLQQIRGAKFLSAKAKEKYQLTQFIKQQFSSSNESATV